jgi:phospholipase D1/2
MVLTHLRQAAEAAVDDLQARAAQNEILSKIFHRDSSNARMLWGLLHIKIIKCVGLRNTDRVAGLVSTFTKGRIDKSDPYVEAYLDEYRLLKTRVIDDNLDPVFEEEFHCPVAHIGETITFRVKDKDVIKDESLGEYTLSVSDLVQTVTESDIHENPQDKLVPGDLKRVGLHKVVYLSSHPKKKEKYGTLEFMIEFIPTRLLPKSPEVPGIYFATTHRNDVKLYMNADDDGSAPIVKYGGIHNDEKVWTPPRLWRDIYDAICNAKHFIYVAGWSVDTDQYLLRGKELDEALGHGKYNPQIGELLKMKSDEGVIVNLMQWDDYSSNFAFPGMMKTYDEKTRNFFRNTKVNSRFMHMVGGETNTVLEGQNKKMAFTHHQKFIIMDAPKTDGSGGCELFAFIGGIDLTEGRWDNRQVRHRECVLLDGASIFNIMLILSANSQ